MTQTQLTHISFQELCHSVCVDHAFLLELIEQDVVAPTSGTHPIEWRFPVVAVNVVQKALRIHRDLGVELGDIALMLSMLDEMEQLRAENKMLKQRLNRFLVDYD